MTPGQAVAALQPVTRPAQQFVPTGSFALDLALGGGYPVGMLTEITGEANSGKTLLALLAAGQMQKFGTVAFVDTWREFAPSKAKLLGIDTDSLLVLPDLPQCLGPIRFLVVDDTEHGHAIPLWHLWGGARERVTVVAASRMYRLFSGSRPRIDLRKNGRDIAAASVETHTGLKRQCTQLYFGENGIDRGRELLDLAERAGLVNQAGSHYYLRRSAMMRDAHLGNGSEEAARVAAGVSWLPDAIARLLSKPQDNE